jgi:cell division protein FtsQ
MKAPQPRTRLHGSGFVAPDEGFAQNESPAPGPVAEALEATPNSAARSIGQALFGALKLAAGLIIVVGASVAVAWSAHRYALTSPRFSVQKVEVKGAERLGSEQIRQLSGVSIGTNIFAFDTELAEKKLLESPWLSEAKITRKLPGTLQVEVAERSAAAIAHVVDRLYLVTRTGEPFKEIEAGDPYDLPIITGASPENLARDKKRELERIQIALEVLRQYDRLNLSRVQPAEEVHMTDSGDVSLTVGKEGLTMQLGSGPWRKKLLMGEQIIGELRKKGQKPGIVFLDNVAHPERVVVRMK